MRRRFASPCGYLWHRLHAYTGTQPFFNYPRILGHELALEIVALGATLLEHDLQVGDACCVRPYLNCGHAALANAAL